MKEIEKITNIINTWDPIELFNCGVPTDEYKIEVKKIQEYCLYKETTVQGLAEQIYMVFSKSFGEDVFLKTLEECKKIANLILLEA